MVLDFQRDGAELIPAALGVRDIASIEMSLADHPVDRPGIRLVGLSGLTELLNDGTPLGTIASSFIDRPAVAVRAILFDKSPQSNWSLGWHQDRTIAVRNRFDVDGFGPWTIKSGIVHVTPPFSLLEAMVTLRLHLDDVEPENAPLLISPGSHRAGCVPETEIQSVVEQYGIHACLAQRGDVWAYATPILHASDRATYPSRRRVLQIDYSADTLPEPMQWLGI